jgi:hypothetical protein
MIRIKWQPSERDLRVFAVGQAVVFALVCSGWIRRGGSLTVAVILGICSTAVAVFGLARPKQIRVLYLAWMILVFPIGWLVTQGLLAATFLLLIVPLGFLLRCFGIDPLSRRFENRQPSYWVKRRPMPPATQYFRQF